MSSSSSNSPCAACKFLRRKCTQECVFAPYFPPDNPAKFANVHKVFGASNVAKLLNDIPGPNREDAVNSLAYEADARLRDPVYGCVGLISILQQRLKKIQIDLVNAKSELSAYIGSSAMLPMVYNNPAYTQQQQLIINPSASTLGMQYNNMPHVMDPMSGGVGPSNQQQQQMIEARQMAEVRENQELLRTYEQQMLIRQQLHQHHQQQQQQQQTHHLHHHSQNDFTVGFNSGFDSDDPSVPFLQMNSPAHVHSTVIEVPNVNLGGGFDINSNASNPFHQQLQESEMPHHHHHQHHHHQQPQQQNQLQTQHLLQSEQQQQQQQQQLQLQQPLQQNLNHDDNNNNLRPGSNEGRSVDPSS